MTSVAASPCACATSSRVERIAVVAWEAGGVECVVGREAEEAEARGLQPVEQVRRRFQLALDALDLQLLHRCRADQQLVRLVDDGRERAGRVPRHVDGEPQHHVAVEQKPQAIIPSLR